MRIKISKGNTKLGKVANISLPPIKACRPGTPCARGCYAMKAYRMYKNTRKAWDSNLAFYQEDPDGYFAEIWDWLYKHKPRFFRWHVAGDIIDAYYLAKMIDIAHDFPHVKFLAFTKYHELDYRLAPANLTVVFSMWPGWGDGDADMPRAWLHDDHDPDPRIPADALECPGGCEACGMCWHLKDLGRDVVFHKH